MNDTQCPQNLSVNGVEFCVLKLLGKGKGGYSYLAQRDNSLFVLKQIHHEPCAYYNFGDKIQAEIHDYQRLNALGIPMPQLIDVDVANERILKQYIEGETAETLIKSHTLPPQCIAQVEDMCRVLYAANLNIDYFPTNFVLMDGKLYYIDYECNTYSDEWNFENWGKQYWTV